MEKGLGGEDAVSLFFPPVPLSAKRPCAPARLVSHFRRPALGTVSFFAFSKVG